MATYKSVGTPILSRKAAQHSAKQQVEHTADEPILAAMVKTAIDENLDTPTAKQTAPVTWMDVEQGGRQELDPQHDGFRYDYDDNI